MAGETSRWSLIGGGIRGEERLGAAVRVRGRDRPGVAGAAVRPARRRRLEVLAVEDVGGEADRPQSPGSGRVVKENAVELLPTPQALTARTRQ